MAGSLSTLRNAWQLYKSDSTAETIAALFLVAFVAYPVAVQLWRAHRRSGQR